MPFDSGEIKAQLARIRHSSRSIIFPLQTSFDQTVPVNAVVSHKLLTSLQDADRLAHGGIEGRINAVSFYSVLRSNGTANVVEHIKLS
jgi:hypothetical protein